MFHPVRQVAASMLSQYVVVSLQINRESKTYHAFLPRHKRENTTISDEVGTHYLRTV